MDFVLKFSQKGGSKLPEKNITSLKDAFESYVWGYSVSSEIEIPDSIRTGTFFQDANKVLSYCEQKLKEGLKGDEVKLRNASAIVLSWGGVLKKGNKAFIEKTASIKEEYEKVMNVWDDLKNEKTYLKPEYVPAFKSNAGFTKIYSLILDDFVIYDSRVAVALAFLITNFFHNNIPKELLLFIPASQASTQHKRVVDKFFKPTYQKDSRHFYSNVKSSWLLSETVEKVNKSNPDHKIKIRELEAALFMIGYDIPQN